MLRAAVLAQRHARPLARLASSSARYPPHKLMPMPRLSPSMTSGVVHRWLVAEGSQLSTYDLVFEVATRELLEEPTAEPVVLEIETHEEGWLARVLVAEGAAAVPDQPMCANAGPAVCPSPR